MPASRMTSGTKRRTSTAFSSVAAVSAITPEALAGTSPYLNEHLNRFGSYELDLSKQPPPLPFELPPRLQPSRYGAAPSV